MCDYLYDLYLRTQYLYLLLWFSLFRRDGYVCGMCILKYLTGLSTDTYVRIMCVSWLCVVFDLLIGWSYLFVVCGPLAGPYFAASFLLWCLFFLIHFSYIIFIVVGNFLVVCLPYIFAFLLLLNCWTLVMNFALVIKRFIVSWCCCCFCFFFHFILFTSNLQICSPCNQLR